MSERWFTHASPTLFNAGTCRPQLSSCFLICMKDDSIEVSQCLTKVSLSLYMIRLYSKCVYIVYISIYIHVCDILLVHVCILVFQGIYETLKTCALISKSAGGIGLAVHCIRSEGSFIAGVGVV